MDNLIDKIKKLIIETLNLEELRPEDIQSEAPLFGEGLGLDSIDALELGVALQKTFSIPIEGQSEKLKKAFYSVKTIAEFIKEGKEK